MVLSTFLQLSNVKPTQSAVHQQAAKLFLQHCMAAGNYELNSAFEKADKLLEQKRTGSQFHYISPLAL
jgi:hypothetical protein